MRDEGQLPDCDDGCPHEPGVDVCATCPYDSKEYLELTDVHPDYLEANNYLTEKELGLQPPRSALTPRQIEAIKFVHAEQYRQREAHRKEKKAAEDKVKALNEKYGK